MRGAKLAVWIVAAVIICAGIYSVHTLWFNTKENSRESLLHALPADANTVIFLDVAELRQGAVLRNLAELSSGVTTDADYKQFVNETGFNYEKDLDRVGIAVEHRNGMRNLFALADGNFDRRKIEAYLRKNAVGERRGLLEIFHLAEPNSNPYLSSVQRWISIAFLSDHRIVLFDGEDLNAELDSARRDAGHSEWTERFERLAGTPAFVLMRQDAAIGALLNHQSPGGLRSPQLAQLLDQLLWVSIAGKPEGGEFRVVFEGECPNEALMRQLSEFLNGIALMADAGLNDPKLRQRMDPGEREAYLQLVHSIDVMRLDRGSSKAVRATFVVTPEMWNKLAPAAQPRQENKDPRAQPGSSPKKSKNGGQKQSARRPQ